MRTKLLTFSIIFLISGFSVEAQVFKKLKNAVKQGFEVIEGTEEDGADGDDPNTKKKKRSRSDSNTGNMETIPAPPDNNIQLPESYQFSYRASMRIENDQGSAEPIFFLEPDAPYYARKQANTNLTEFLVLDNQNNMVTVYGEYDGQRLRKHNYLNLETKASLIGAYRGASSAEPVKTLQGKNILGYNCEGYQIVTEAGTTQLWVTNEAPVSLFRTVFERQSESLAHASFHPNSMIMEVSFTSNEAPETSYHMICTGLQPESLILRTTDYQEAL